MSRIILFGATGIFGGHVMKALAGFGISLTLAGRDRGKVEELARRLGPDHSAVAADLTKPDSCRAALVEHQIAVNCAGPFNSLGAVLLEACLDAGCHYVDIAEDRGYAALVRGYDAKLRDRSLAAVYGCSSLPGISGALALLAAEQAAAPVERVRVTLFIGNNSPKGQAAVHSLVVGLGKPIAAPQGTIRGFRDREVVTLPAPFGKRGVFNFDSPEYDLFPKLLGVRAVGVKVGFELRLATYTFALLARLGLNYGSWTARYLEVTGMPFQRLGCSGAAIMSELFLADGRVRRAAISAAEDGQRLAALPCALVARALSEGKVQARGAMTAYEALGARPLLDQLVAAGFRLHTE